MSHDRGVAVVSPSEAQQTPYPFVWVNADGTTRELHPKEREYLETPFTFGDGGRPYVKSNYEALNGWKSLEGFCHRRHLPSGILPGMAPAEDPHPPLGKEGLLAFLRSKGADVEEIPGPDGTSIIRKKKS